MTTMEKICRTCEYHFSFPMETATYPCPACGAVNGRPTSEGTSLASLARATKQRLACQYSEAVISYQHVLLDFPEEHEALWGLALCRYGVEYVDDPRAGKRLPTVHGVRRRPMQLDADYLAAVENAPEEVRAQYEAEALYVDNAMARIRELAKGQPAYDVFICHKTTRPGGDEPTWEVLRASEMAHQLEKQGYRVFFAPEAMKGVLGADYEAAIYHALDTAKVMLLFCTEPDYVSSPWVRSEWTRFLEMTDEREDKCLVPLLYNGFAAGRLPREIRVRRLECVTMDSFTAASDVLRLLEMRCGPRGAGKMVREESAYVQPAQERTAATQEAAAQKPAVSYAPETDFSATPVEGGCAIRKYLGKGGDVNVPATIGGLRVVEIGKEAFAYRSSLTSITLPDGVTTIGRRAFWDCVSLTSITLPDSVTSIERNPFSDCEELRDIIVSPKHPTLEIIDGALIDKTEKRLVCCPCAYTASSYAVPEGIRIIEEDAFDRCTTLTSITIPESVTSIGRGAFYECNSLTSITIPKNVTSIEYHAFAGCKSLTSITIPESVTSIGYSAFYGCNSLMSIKLPEGLTTIGESAFEHCSSLTSIRLPDSVTSIEGNPFRDCEELRDIIVSPKHPTLGIIDGVLFDKTERRLVCYPCAHTVSEYAVPQGTQVIGVSAFASCKSLTSIALPEGLTSIERCAFSSCTGLQSLKLPRSLNQIGLWAFIDCNELPLLLQLELKKINVKAMG